MSNKLHQVMGIGLLLASGLLTMCSPPTPTPEPDQVVLQINWYHEAEFAGYYVAKAKGFYADENIEVTILDWDFDIDTNQRLLDGQADFAITTFDQHRTRVEGNEPLVAVMTVFQIPPPVLFALADSGIQEPKDMAGRRVAIKGEIWRHIVYSTLTNAGIDLSEIVKVEVEHDEIEMLYYGEVDVWTGFAHDEPVEAQLAGYDLNLIFAADYGVGAYEDLLSVHQDTLAQNPDLVARFVRASLKGWQYAVEHPDEAAEIVARWQPDESVEFHRLAMRALIPLVDTLEAPIGWIDVERWQMAMGDAYDPERPGYTMQFIEAAQE